MAVHWLASGVLGLILAAGPTFVDPAGDAGGAPDIRSVDVQSDADALTFAIHASDVWQGAAAILELDTDDNQATGDAGGERGYELSYVLHSNHDSFTLDESNDVHIAQPAATWRLEGPTLTIAAPRAELRAGATIAFRVHTLAAAGGDTAPDSTAAPWRFSPNAVPIGIAATFTPAAPRHGKSFGVARVTTSFSDGNHGVTPPACTATVGRTALRAGCRWHVPANARGRRLAVTVRAAGLARAYAFRVR